MSDSDQSLTNLRYNQVTQGLEGFGGGSPMWTPLTLVADGGINQLTGDATAGPGVGSQVLTLATVNTDVGSFTSANITVDAKGRITAASNGSGGSQVLPQVFIDNGGASFNDETDATYHALAPSRTITLQKSTNGVKSTIYSFTNNSGGATMSARLYRDGVDITGALGDNQLAGQYQWSRGFIDYPGDTSPHLYQWYVNNPAATGDAFVGGQQTLLFTEEILS